MFTLIWAFIIGTIVAALARLVPRFRGRSFFATEVVSIAGAALFLYLGIALHFFGWGVSSLVQFSVALFLPLLGSVISLGLSSLFSSATVAEKRPKQTQQLSPCEPRANAGPPLDKLRDAEAGAHPPLAGPYIFLSYASANRDFAKALANALVQEGWSVWWDRTIPPGKTFDEVIVSALDAAKCMIVLWSNASVSSDWVKNEAREGARRRILIPALIADVTIPFEFRHIQAADLAGWPSPGHAGFRSLVASVADLIGATQSGTSASAG